jgi:hypothetical protein
MTKAYVFVLSSLVLSACDGGGSSGGPFATRPGDSILTASVTKVTVASTGGGLVGPRPTGAGCDSQVWSYVLQIDSGALSWSRCDVAGTGATAADYTPASGARTLSAAELEAAKTAVRAVLVSARTTCGADKPSDTLEVASASANLLYGDDFYACTMQYPSYVESDGLDALAAALGPLAHD